jgi:hypothetical protein
MKLTSADAKRAEAEIARLDDEIRELQEKTPHLQSLIEEKKAQKKQQVDTVKQYYIESGHEWRLIKQQLDLFDEVVFKRDSWVDCLDPLVAEAERRLDALCGVVNLDAFEWTAVIFARQLLRERCPGQPEEYDTVYFHPFSRRWLRRVLPERAHSAAWEKLYEEEEEEWDDLADSLELPHQKSGRKIKKTRRGSKPRNAGRGVAARSRTLIQEYLRIASTSGVAILSSPVHLLATPTGR